MVPQSADRPIIVTSHQSTYRMSHRSRQRGFSLLELIASIAIVSLVSAALFQTTGQWLALSNRAAAAAEASLSDIANQKMFDRLVAGVTFAWPEEPDNQFSGGPARFSGLTATTLHAPNPQLSAFSMSLVRNGQAMAVEYEADGVRWTIRDFGDGSTAAFSYLGADGAWRGTWPPQENPEPGPYDDARYFTTPQTPLAVRLSVVTASGDVETWIADIASTPFIPQRPQDLTTQP